MNLAVTLTTKNFLPLELDGLPFLTDTIFILRSIRKNNKPLKDVFQKLETDY